jgi:hypothetical protein
MSSDPERKHWMGRSNQPPQPECCREPGQTKALAQRDRKPNDLLEAYTGTSTGRKRESRLAQAIQPRNDTRTCKWGRRRISGTQHGGSRQGEASRDLPGSQSVACAESVARNLGGPADPRRANYGSQAGRPAQRQGELAHRKLGVRLVHSNSWQGPGGPEASEGANTSTPSAQETRAVRTTAYTWPTSLRTRASWGEEPGAGKPPAGICEGGAGQPASLPRSRGSGGEVILAAR